MKRFKESQNMLAIWLFVIFALIIGYEIYLAFPNPAGIFKEPGFWFPLAVLLFLVLVRLKTRYDAQGIHIVFLPFIWKKFISWEEIGSAYLRTYSLSDFGGWGFRIGKEGKAYTTKGNHGLQLIFKNGSKILIGTQEPDKIQEIINQYKPYKDEF